VVGAHSTIGAALVSRLKQQRQDVITTGRRDASVDVVLDLADADSVLAVDRVGPVGAAVICAGITGEDNCRRSPELAHRVNVDNTIALARRLMSRGTYVLFLSSNAVFDGSVAQAPADSPRRPLTLYGQGKAAVEAALLPEGAAVLRLSKVLAANHRLFSTWAQALLAGQPITAAENLRFAPLPLDGVVSGIEALIEGLHPGLHQWSGIADISYAEAAVELAARLGRSEILVRGEMIEMQTPPPAHTTLATTETLISLGFTQPTWRKVLDTNHTFVAPPPELVSSAAPQNGG